MCENKNNQVNHNHARNKWILTWKTPTLIVKIKTIGSKTSNLLIYYMISKYTDLLGHYPKNLLISTYTLIYVCDAAPPMLHWIPLSLWEDAGSLNSLKFNLWILCLELVNDRASWVDSVKISNSRLGWERVYIGART